MRFLMVDKICALEKGRCARGIKNISWNDYFLEEIFPGVPAYSPVVAVEAVAQLVSWIIVEARDFTVKPVIALTDSYRCSGRIIPGDQLELEGEIESLGDDSALAHGTIYINGSPVIELRHAVCYLYPLHELDPPEMMRRQFENLYDEGYPLPRDSSYGRQMIPRESIPVAKKLWIDRVLESGPDTMRGVKNVTATAGYFNDHFSLKPVFPGALMFESMVSLGRMLAEQCLESRGLGNKKPVLSHCSKIKFRKFVHPGDRFVVEASVSQLDQGKSSLKVRATVLDKTAATAVINFLHFNKQEYIETFTRCT